MTANFETTHLRGRGLAAYNNKVAINYGANEGIEWALLTNGRQFQFYKILFEKPISERLVFEVDFTAEDFNMKEAHEELTFFHRDAVLKNSLANLWARYTALDPVGIAGLLFSPQVVTFLKKELKANHDTKFEDDEIMEALTEVVCNEIPFEKLKIPKLKPAKKKVKVSADNAPTEKGTADITLDSNQ